MENEGLWTRIFNFLNKALCPTWGLNLGPENQELHSLLPEPARYRIIAVFRVLSTESITAVIFNSVSGD